MSFPGLQSGGWGGAAIARIGLAAGRLPWPEILAGLALTAVNAAASWWINRAALRAGSMPRFLSWGLLGNAVRFFLVVIAIVAYDVGRLGDLGPFAGTVVIGYLVTLAAHVAALHVAGPGGERGDHD